MKCFRFISLLYVYTNCLQLIQGNFITFNEHVEFNFKTETKTLFCEHSLWAVTNFSWKSNKHKWTICHPVSIISPNVKLKPHEYQCRRLLIALWRGWLWKGSKNLSTGLTLIKGWCGGCCQGFYERGCERERWVGLGR